MSKKSSQDSVLAEQLRQLVMAIETSGSAIMPTSNQELLQSIVDTAARIFGAAAASIALIDEREQIIEFKVAYGVGNEDVIGMRIPLDSGIAGYVVMTGQPIGISDVQQDPRFNLEFAESTGYVPKSILAMPLIRNDRVIGVMEVLDKIDEPSFGLKDMELLGIFAQQAAIAIFQSQQFENLSSALIQSIKDLSNADTPSDLSELFSVLEEKSGEDERRKDLYALANHFYTISEFGESERRMCLHILGAFSEYLHSKPRLAP